MALLAYRYLSGLYCSRVARKTRVIRKDKEKGEPEAPTAQANNEADENGEQTGDEPGG